MADASAESRIVIFLGPPGVGKGTQARHFADKWGVVHIATGDMLRDAAARGTALGLEAKTKYMDEGHLVPDEVVEKIVEERLQDDDTRPGAIFDGFPRTEAQASFLDRALGRQGREVTQAIYLDADEDVVVDRVAGRRTCPECQATFHVQNNPPAKDDVCDGCGGALQWRDDDRPETVRERLLQYRRNTEPLVRFYESRGLLVRIDASGNVRSIREAIDSAEPSASGAVNG